MIFFYRAEDRVQSQVQFLTRIHAKLFLQDELNNTEWAYNRYIQLKIYQSKRNVQKSKWQKIMMKNVDQNYKHVVKYPFQFYNQIRTLRQQYCQPRMTQGFKNLLKPFLFNDDSFQPLLKKNQQYRKTTQVSIDHFQTIVKNFQSFQATYSKLITDYDQQTEKKEINIPQYYHQYIQLYRNIYSEQKYFCEKLTNNFKELTSLCNSIFINYSNLMLTFQGLIRSYKSHEQILFELSKKYFRSHKTMISNIELYKSSFTDVKLIYNMDQKIKRFNACEGIFKNLSEQLETIEEKLKSINEEKQQIISSYIDIQKQFKTTLKTIGSKLIAMAKLFMHDYCIMQKAMITYLAQKKFTLEKIQLKTFFSEQTKIIQEDLFSVQIDKSKCQYLPTFLVYSKFIKEESYQTVGKLVVAYVKEAESKIQQRLLLNKKAIEFTTNFVKIYEKSYYFTLKQITSNFQKNKKKISQIFGNRLSSFLKSNSSVFDISIGINQKLIKRTPAKLKQVQASLSQQAKTLDIFLKELRSNVDKFLKKKEVKKIMDGDTQTNQFTEQQPSNVDLTNFKNELGKFFQYLAHLIEGFVQKIKKIEDQVKLQYNAFVNDYSISTNQIYSLCCQYQEIYFGDGDFANNYKKYELDIDKTLQNQSKFFQQINFGVLLKEQFTKITFQSQINKVEEYKKIKKPMEIQIEQQPNAQEDKNKDQIKRKDCIDQQIVQPQRKNSGDKSKIKESITPQKQPKQIKQKQNKYQQFLTSKIAFLSDEKFCGSYSCGLSDKIILTGRLYITNKRVCFHSKFNPNTVFFGQTFIQIPRKDIKKIQKRYNAIVFDNSISITTVHGQVFLTSFFSRNQAYDLICSALDINAEEIMFEPEQIKQEVVVQVQPMLQEDDIKEEEQLQRGEAIDRGLLNYQYKDIYNAQFTFSGLNALKFLKIFELTQDFTYNRKNYKSWLEYFKITLEHKECDLGQWSPNLSQFLNSSNIKANAPLSFKKKVNCIVPIPNSGVPFMPKIAKSEEQTVLHLISKDKYIIESTIQNSGVPYSDSFNLKFRKSFESKGENKCSMKIQMYINFVSTPMIKSIIQSKTLQQTKTSYKKYQEEISKYLKYLDKKKKSAKTQSKVEGNQQQSKQNGANEEYEKQIGQLRQSQQKLKEELKISKVKLQHNKKLLLASVIINVILMLIILS